MTSAVLPPEAEGGYAVLSNELQQLGGQAAELGRVLSDLAKSRQAIAWTKNAALAAGSTALGAFTGFFLELAIGHREIAESKLVITALRESIRIKGQWHDDSLALAHVAMTEFLGSRQAVREMLQHAIAQARSAKNIKLYRMLSESLQTINRASPEVWKRLFFEAYEAEMGERTREWSDANTLNA